MVKRKTDLKKMNFKFERRRLKKDKIRLPVCRDFRKKEHGDSCVLAVRCKNATYKSEFGGVCYGGAKGSEIRDRQKYLEVNG